MKKYRVTTRVETYFDVIIEAEDEQDARNRACIDFDNSRDLLETHIEVVEVMDEAELGDVG